MSDTARELAERAAMEQLSNYELTHTRAMSGEVWPNEGGCLYPLKAVLKMLSEQYLAGWNACEQQRLEPDAETACRYCGHKSKYGDFHLL